MLDTTDTAIFARHQKSEADVPPMPIRNYWIGFLDQKIPQTIKSMMSKNSLLALLSFAATVGSASAFVPAAPVARHAVTSTSTSTSTSTCLSAVINKDFGRAVECAERFGECDADEMVKLADKLEDIEGCVYEDGVQAKDVCDKEIQDRKDVADTLKMQAELQLRCVLFWSI